MGQPDPRSAVFAYILSYSPYENVRALGLSADPGHGGLNDPRVTYWEPAKWTARLRATRPTGNILLLKTNMGAGHAGSPAGSSGVHEVAEEYVFILAAFGLAGP